MTINDLVDDPQGAFIVTVGFGGVMDDIENEAEEDGR